MPNDSLRDRGIFYKNAAKMAPATPRPNMGFAIPAAPVAGLDVADSEAVVRVLRPLVPVAVVVRRGVPVVTVLLPATALLTLAAMLLTAPDGMRAGLDGMGTGINVVSVSVSTEGAGGREVLIPTGMPDGPVGTKLAGVVTGAG